MWARPRRGDVWCWIRVRLRGGHFTGGVLTADLGVEVSVPSGWTRVPSDEFPVAFAGLVERGYRPTIALTHEEFAPPTPEGLAAGITALHELQAANYDGFEIIAERADEIDGRAAYVEHFRWYAADPGASITQLLALVVLRPGLVLKIDGACLSELADQHLPVLDEIVRSIAQR